jgi:ADP-dependent NAD(P)H-hydrate dehydratase / NAD(P)H-hydrate epimerase
MKILTIAQMQKAEKDCDNSGTSLAQLMENAGKAVAEEMRNILGDVQNQQIAVLAGPGNNGGDGLVAARHLHDWGAEVRVYLCGPQTSPHLDQIKAREISVIEASTDIDYQHLKHWLKDSKAVLDALFGTGASRPLSGHFLKVLTTLNEFKKTVPALRVIALDLPSGLNADTGLADTATPFADNTITLGFPKIGLFQADGIERAGKISVVEIGILPSLVDYVEVELLGDDWIRGVLPKRPLSSNKGTYGRILALVGSMYYPGAAYLACMGSIRVGAGLTTLAIARGLFPILATKLTEVIYLPLPEIEEGTLSDDCYKLLAQRLQGNNCWLVGCGLGQNSSMINLVTRILSNPDLHLPTTVVDADGLNLLSSLPDWRKCIPDGAILTPHPGEMARLSGKTVQDIQINRIRVASEAAIDWGKTVVLKGAYTVIASPDGKLQVSPFANPGLASAGTGDILAGAIAGLVAQGLSSPEAAACGVYLHGKAGEIVSRRMGDAGTIASDLLPALPEAIRQLRQR